MNLVRTDIPASITTIEGLAAWALLLLTNTHAQMTIAEAPGIVEKVADAQIIQYEDGGAWKYRFIGRASLEISSAFQGAGKQWQHVQILSNASVPNDFKA